MYRPVGTIKSVLDSMERNEFVLPAIQREFVWRPEQIAKLFDSVMQGYSFGEFLLWNIKPENSSRYRYYDFVRHYHERNAPNCPELDSFENQQVVAVLDGQQRLTAFNIGLRGSMAAKIPGRRWSDTNAFPRRVLALDLLGTPDLGEEGKRYTFEFIDEDRIGRTGDSLWFRVSDILNLEPGPDTNEWLLDYGIQGELNRTAHRMLARLHTAIHAEQTVFCYEEENQDIEHVLNMFVRRNSGGTQLSYSDLLLSIAVSQWTELDARKEISELVYELNRIGSGFTFSKDFVMKAGFMLADIPSVSFGAANVTSSNMSKIQESWSKIREALIATVELVSSFGFDSRNIGADSALLPIAYFLYREGAPAGFTTRARYKDSRNAIRGWLIRSILKATGVWGGGGGDSMLVAIRQSIRDNGTGQFPVAEIQQVMLARNRGLDFTQDEIEDLSEARLTQHQRIFPLLSLLFPFVNTATIGFTSTMCFRKAASPPPGFVRRVSVSN